MNAREEALRAGAERVAACRRCAIAETRRHTVYGEGDPRAALVVVGEGPGETEDRLGRPFVGRAGHLLDEMLGSIGLARSDVFICNTVKCRPTRREGEKLRNRAPLPAETANCRPYLDEQLALLRPRAVLALGGSAAKAFLGPAFAFSRDRGRWFPGPDGARVLATFHPAYLLRLTGGRFPAVEALVGPDLDAVRVLLAAEGTASPGLD